MLGALTTLSIVAWCGAAAASASPPSRPSDRPPVVLLAVPGLVWSDVLGMPQLRALASRSAVGELSVKTSGDVTRCPAALTAVSAGNRTTAPNLPRYPCVVRLGLGGWQSLQQANRTSRYDARLGALGDALQSAGVRAVAVGALAIPMLADTAGRGVTITSSLATAMRSGGVVGIVDDRLYGGPSARLPAARTAVDDQVAATERALPAGATFMVAGVSDQAVGNAALHAVVLSGPGWTHSELRSSAAGRAPYVQLIDIAPTLLAAADVRVPSFMVGRPMQRSGGTVAPILTFVDDNRHAVLQRTLGQRVFLVLGIAAIVMMVLAAGPSPLGHRIARWLARLIAPAPAMIFLGNGLPWWDWGQWTYVLVVIAGCAAVAAVTVVVGRRNRTAGLIAVPAFTFVALVVDQLTGAHLQLSAPLGDDPLVAGRFSGMGNLDFAVMATSALLLAGIIGGQLPRLQAVVASGAIVLVAIVVDGAPRLGNDLGGVLALVPAALIVVALIAGVRVTRLRLAALVITTLAVAVGVALVDYSRPATDQTHVGRFVGQVLHGGAGTEVHRKFDASLATFGWTVGTFVAGFAIVLGYLARHRIRAALERVPGASAAAIAVTVLAVLGAALNDSGIVIAAMAAIVGVSSFYGARSGGPGGATAAATG